MRVDEGITNAEADDTLGRICRWKMNSGVKIK